MRDPIRWRTRLAERVASHYAAHKGVDAVALIGSVAHGWADGYSDIEIAVFWRSEPSDDHKRLIASQLGAVDRHEGAFSAEMQAWCEDYFLDGSKVDLGHWTSATMDGIIADVVDECDAALPKQASASALVSAIPLQGTSMIGRWQERVRPYPEGLAEAMVRQHLDFSPEWMLRMLAERNDFPLVRRNVSTLTYRLFMVLCGLNHVYYPGHKWLPHYLKGMEIAPPGFVARLDAALSAPLMQAVAEFERLVNEVIGLVEAHLPSVDTATVHARLREPPQGATHDADTIT